MSNVMRSGSAMSGGLLGDLFVGDNNPGNYRIIAPSGDEYSMSGDELEALRGDDDPSGDDFEGDDDSPVISLGDFGSGDMTGGLMGDVARLVARAPRAMRAPMRMAASIPGAAMARRPFSPLIPNNGTLDQAPTRAMLLGTALLDTINRFETQYPGFTRTAPIPTVGGTQIAIFNTTAPNDPASQGSPLGVLRAPFVLINIAVSANFQVANARVGYSITATNEGGVAVSPATWSLLLTSPAKSLFLVAIPYVEVSSQIFPAIINASGALASATQATVTFTTLPANSSVLCQLPGQDSSQYQEFKKTVGIASPVTTLSRLLNQPSGRRSGR